VILPGSISSEGLSIAALLRKTGPLLLAGLTAIFLCSSPGLAGEKPFGGIGVQVVPTATGELVALHVVPGTPAARSGLRPGDLIIQVNDFSLIGSDFAQVVTEHLWGPVGSEISLVYLRPGQAGRHSAAFKRVPLDPAVTESPGIRMILPEQ
jgi:S1-C subfamily serine protease